MSAEPRAGEAEREAFEAWWGIEERPDARPKNTGWSSLKLDAYKAWQARAQLAPTTNGWVMVPVEPTLEMLEAAMQVKRERLKHALTEMRAGKDEFEARSPVVKGEWLAMLAAAPVFQPQHGEEA